MGAGPSAPRVTTAGRPGFRTSIARHEAGTSRTNRTEQERMTLHMPLVLLSLLAAPQRPGGPAPAAGPIGDRTWPSWRGYGSGTTTDAGLPLADEPGQIREVWTSDIQDIAYTWPKLGGNGFTGNFICGGYGSPVVVAGRVFIAWWEPSGERIDRKALAKAQDKREGKWRAGADELLAGHDDAPVTFSIDARVLGNRLIWGSCQTAGGGAGASHVLRGGLCEADTCQIEGPSTAQQARVKQMQAAMGK